MIEQRLGIEDAAFWSDPWRTRKTVQRAMMAGKTEAVLVDAPEKVSLDSRDTIPLAVVRVAPVGAPSNFQRAAVVTAMSSYTGELSAALAFDAPAHTAPVGQAGVGGAQDAMLGEAHIVDLARRLRLPLIRGDYLVTMLAMDRIIGRRRIRVVESTSYEDPAVELFLRHQLGARLDRPRVFPEPGSDPRSILPLYEAMDESPPLPPDLGIELALERVNLLPATECVVFGSYRLPVEPRHVTPATTLLTNPQAPTAIIPITVLLTGSVDAAPRLAKLHVPCRRPLLEVDGQSIASGHFAVDLGKLVRIGITPQTFFVYGFSGAIMTGPVPTAFVRIPVLPHAAR